MAAIAETQRDPHLNTAITRFEEKGSLVFLSREVNLHPSEYDMVLGNTVQKVSIQFMQSFTQHLDRTYGKGNWHFKETMGLAHNGRVVETLDWGKDYMLNPNQQMVLVSLEALKQSRGETREITIARVVQEEKKVN